MLTVNKVMPQGKGLAAVLLRRAATVELDWDVRQKSRLETTDSLGRRLGVFLPRGTPTRGGDVWVAQDGSLIRMIAARQSVLVITACPAHGTPFDMTRAAYHLGNRHVPIELAPDRLQIEPDPVLADMLRAMHLIVHETEAPFEPEGGAYAAGGHAAHGHAHGKEHHHDHAHDESHHHAHELGHAHPQKPVHGHVHPPAHDQGHVAAGQTSHSAPS